MKNEEIYHFDSINEMMHRDNLTKHEVIDIGAKLAQQQLDEGYSDEWQMLAVSTRNKAFWDAFEGKVRESISDTPEKCYKAYNCEFSMMNTGDRLDYAADPIYADLQKQLKQREDLLKLAFKSTETYYDQHGAEVPRVPIKTHGKSVLKIKY